MDTLLNRLGFDKNESALYLACLQRGADSPAQLVAQTGLKRSTVYFYLDKLFEKGLLSKSIKGKRTYIRPTLPDESINSLLQAQEKQLTLKRKAAKALIPQLMKLTQERAETTEVQLYEGASGARAVMRILLKQNKDNFWFGSTNNFADIVNPDTIYRGFTIPRMQQKTTGFAITDRRVLKRNRASEELGNFRKFRFLKDDFTMPAGFMISGTYIVIGVKYGKVVKMILIKDALITEMMRIVFMQLWDTLPAK